MTREIKRQDPATATRAVRSIFLDASEHEIRDVFEDAEVDFELLAARGAAAAKRALSVVVDMPDVEALRRGLGTLVRMLRRKQRISIEALAERIRVSQSELHSIERDVHFNPSPRTVFQLEQHFKLPERSLVLLSGAVQVDPGIRQEAVRFAASAEDIVGLSRDERRMLNEFVRFLRDHTDQ
jgi:transcriptional regulator with XRE-family HTH domain